MDTRTVEEKVESIKLLKEDVESTVLYKYIHERYGDVCKKMAEMLENYGVDKNMYIEGLCNTIGDYDRRQYGVSLLSKREKYIYENTKRRRIKNKYINIMRKRYHKLYICSSYAIKKYCRKLEKDCGLLPSEYIISESLDGTKSVTHSLKSNIFYII